MAEVKPASRMVSGQFINVQRLHVAKLLTDEAGGEATYDTPVDFSLALQYFKYLYDLLYRSGDWIFYRSGL